MIASSRLRGQLLMVLCLFLYDYQAIAADVNDSEVNVMRCCRIGEDLGEPEVGSDKTPDCVPTNKVFLPTIYSPEKGDFLPEIPKWWKVHEATQPRCPNSQKLRYVPPSNYNPFIVFDFGEVALELGSKPTLKPDEYCLGGKSLLVCKPNNHSHLTAVTIAKPRIRKCCGEDAVYEKNSCVEIESKQSESLEEEKILLLSSHSTNVNLSVGMELVRGFPVCQHLDNFTIVGELKEAQLQPDASLLLSGQRIPAEEFCIERVRSDDRQRMPAKLFACTKHATKSLGVPFRDIRFTLYPVGFIISAIFLAMTLVAGWLLPASHHVLHWRCQTYHVACLMFGDMCMAVIQLAGNSLQGEYCRALAILAHFFFLATFFWLNTMCFNIWWTFRDLRPASLEKGQELLRLRFYGAYAWGGPLVVAGLAAFLDHLPRLPGQSFLRPRFGEKQCWFYGDMEILAYFFGPIGVLLVINLLFFMATARELTCGLWKGEFVKSTTERAALGKVCLKLVVVMGVPWIFDVISWMAGGPDFLWYLTDLLNAAQGVLIFIVVGCQPQVRAALKRFCLRDPRANANRQGNQLSTTSHGMPSIGDSVTQNPSTKTAPLETIC
ncbi:probable G-protein coupled receptor Mth-like 1 [Phymastichus coffea]|uniref:probable G-protein coupled receptor Mth-like 1 n=1 Tax=Phymastichus coffea TaxID=108790 RepID=UPI00273CBB4A|nr:probable G-protein coupled receptor Mth-like 1 [Phymastichus coffea]